MKLDGAIVVITGSSRGFGKALAGEFLKAGAKVVTSSNSAMESKEAVGIFIRADVRKESAVLELAEKTVKRFGKIDIWINNAGIQIPQKSVEELDFKRVHDMFEVNLFGTMYGAKAALLQMKKQQFGTIINILSTAALDGRANLSSYCASKFAIAGFSKSLRLEAQPHHIQVINVYPGGMQTHLYDEHPPADYLEYMKPDSVAQKVVSNMKQESPELELIIKRPKN
ncbi:MAG: SDR family NAD(P)-dependent oxidoreductase [Candidatus ainarchaeum sp.]|nr:SDR family NAD(P)-dependent oxidoreductase [Candidatus ainarchaeum sp.]